MSTVAELCVPIQCGGDVVPARARGRELAGELGFSRTDATLIATAISEVARNIVVHAGRGEVVLEPVVERRRFGIRVTARDSGPGISDVGAALQEGNGTNGGLGLGLPGTQRIMDEFAIDTRPGDGTAVRMVMWRPRDELELLRAEREA